MKNLIFSRLKIRKFLPFTYIVSYCNAKCSLLPALVTISDVFSVPTSEPPVRINSGSWDLSELTNLDKFTKNFSWMRDQH